MGKHNQNKPVLPGGTPVSNDQILLKEAVKKAADQEKEIELLKEQLATEKFMADENMKNLSDQHQADLNSRTKKNGSKNQHKKITAVNAENDNLKKDLNQLLSQNNQLKTQLKKGNPVTKQLDNLENTQTEILAALQGSAKVAANNNQLLEDIARHLSRATFDPRAFEDRIASFEDKMTTLMEEKTQKEVAELTKKLEAAEAQGVALNTQLSEFENEKEAIHKEYKKWNSKHNLKVAAIVVGTILFVGATAYVVTRMLGKNKVEAQCTETGAMETIETGTPDLHVIENY